MGLGESDSFPRGYKIIGPRKLEEYVGEYGTLWSKTLTSCFATTMLINYDDDGQLCACYDGIEQTLKTGDIIGVGNSNGEYVFIDDSD